MNLDIFKINDPSGKMYKESYVSKNFTEEYEFIIQKIDIDIPFKEKVYLVLLLLFLYHSKSQVIQF